MPTILGANTLSSGFDVANSIRLDGRDSDTRLEYTASGASNRRTWTWSAWIKRGTTDSSSNFQVLFSSTPTGPAERIMLENDYLTYDHDKAGTDFSVRSTRLLRDFSAWYHVVVMKDTTQATETNRIKMYINGVQETLVEVQEGYPGQNLESTINTAAETQLFAQADGEEFSGYACEVAFCDGQNLAASDFGEFDSDSPTIWKPKDFKDDVTFGTNGYYLKFEDSSALGTDSSGNGNNYTTANLAATDQSTDTCTNNFATLNPLGTNNSAITYSEANLKAVAESGSTSWTTRYGFSSIGVSAGRWYVEAKCVDSGGSNQFYFGVAKDVETWNFNSSLGYENTGQGWGYYASNGNIVNNESDLYTSGNSYTDGDIISMELDLEDMTLDFYKNGAKEGYQVTSLPAGTYHFAINGYAAIDGEFNFGSPPHAISSGNSDGNGYGNFEYSVPSGHYALNTKNLAEHG